MRLYGPGMYSSGTAESMFGRKREKGQKYDYRLYHTTDLPRSQLLLWYFFLICVIEQSWRRASERSNRKGSNSSQTPQSFNMKTLRCSLLDIPITHVLLWNISTLSKPLALSFLPSNHQIKDTPQDSRSGKPTYRTLHHFFLFAVCIQTLQSGQQRFLDSTMMFHLQTSNCVTIFQKKKIARKKLSASCFFFFFYPEQQSMRLFKSTSLSITVRQSKHTSLVATTHQCSHIRILYVIQWHRNKSTVYCNNKICVIRFVSFLFFFNRHLYHDTFITKINN